MFDIIDSRRAAATTIARTSGVHAVTLSHWKHGKSSPRLSDFENAVKSLGYRLVLEPINDPGKSTP